jgi:hypothetical protein
MYHTGGNYQALSGNDFDNLGPSAPSLPKPLTPFVREVYVENVDPRERFYIGLPANTNNGTTGRKEDLAIPSERHMGKKLHQSTIKSNGGINGDSKRRKDVRRNGMAKSSNGSSSRKRREREREATEKESGEQSANAQRRESY